MENILFKGDNLTVTKMLEGEFSEKIKCIYIDPPYNTKSCFEHYNDSLEHSLWLNMMKERLIILYRLLRKDGTLWISIDDSECHYLKVLCDEIFGRKNFIANVVWQRAESTKADSKLFSYTHDHILVYGKNIDNTNLNKLSRGGDEIPNTYNKTDSSGKKYFLNGLKKTGAGNRREDRPNLYYPIFAPDGSKVFPKNRDGSDGRWKWSKEKYLKEKHKIHWTKGKNGWSVYYKVYANDNTHYTPNTIWEYSQVGSNRTSKNEVKKFNSKTVFQTPKPEALIKRILDLATSPGDIVLDSYAGSGTTGAVAHKMDRRWIMIELGEHCHTHIIPRLEKVIDGEDPGGITPIVNWKGGGSYKFMEISKCL